MGADRIADGHRGEGDEDGIDTDEEEPGPSASVSARSVSPVRNGRRWLSVLATAKRCRIALDGKQSADRVREQLTCSLRLSNHLASAEAAVSCDVAGDR
jgi:hypothetical protein